MNHSRLLRALKAGLVGAVVAILFTAVIRQASAPGEYVGPAVETFLFVFVIRYIMLALRGDPAPPAP